MTGEPDPPGAPRSPSSAQGGEAEKSRAEQVLSQALRLMAGGGDTPLPPGGATGTGGAGEVDPSRVRRLTTGQLLLLAAIIGLMIGIGAGLVSLML